MTLEKPWLLIDTREQVFATDETEKLLATKKYKKCMLDYLMDDREVVAGRVLLGMKGEGPGDYIIVDKKGRLWGIERKTFADLYNTIVQKDADGGLRHHGQLTELIAEYGNKAVLMVHEYKPNTHFVKNKNGKWWKVSFYGNVRTAKRRVFSAMSTRSLVMPVWLVGDDEDAARFLIKMAGMLHDTNIRGRKLILTREEDK